VGSASGSEASGAVTGGGSASGTPMSASKVCGAKPGDVGTFVSGTPASAGWLWYGGATTPPSLGGDASGTPADGGSGGYGIGAVPPGWTVVEVSVAVVDPGSVTSDWGVQPGERHRYSPAAATVG
jgi:hypothetical protein